MQLVEPHGMSKSDPRYAVIAEAAVKSKNLDNAAVYEIRHSFLHEKKDLNDHEVQRRLPSHEAYKALPAKVSQHILMGLDRNWKRFFEALAADKEDPSKF
jgi:transposase